MSRAIQLLWQLESFLAERFAGIQLFEAVGRNLFGKRKITSPYYTVLAGGSYINRQVVYEIRFHGLWAF
jgi:hypothetical protein